MLICALDLASRTGFAIGEAGTIPRSGTVTLKGPEDEAARAVRNAGCFLRDTFTVERPDLVVYEAALPVAAMRAKNNGSWTIEMAWQLVGAVHAVCGPYGIQTVSANVLTVRKHFTGKANWNGRSEAKRAVIARCHALGLMPRESRDDNRADACAIFSWAEATFGRRSPRELVMFGEAAE